MGRHSCCYKQKLRKGLWSPEEDEKLLKHISKYGHGCWSSVPKQAGLQRCGKSCRLRWINYLRPDLKRGTFSQEEEDLIIELHSTLGNRWSQIAVQLPGRTDNEIKNLWNSCIKKKLRLMGIDPNTHKPLTEDTAGHPEPTDYGFVHDKASMSSEACSIPNTSMMGCIPPTQGHFECQPESVGMSGIDSVGGNSSAMLWFHQNQSDIIKTKAFPISHDMDVSSLFPPVPGTVFNTPTGLGSSSYWDGGGSSSGSSAITANSSFDNTCYYPWPELPPDPEDLKWSEFLQAAAVGMPFAGLSRNQGHEFSFHGSSNNPHGEEHMQQQQHHHNQVMDEYGKNLQKFTEAFRHM